MAGARVTSRRPRIGYATKTETMNRVLARLSSDGATTPPRLLSSTMKSNRTPTTRSTHARSTNRRAKRILLVDDDSTVRDSLNDVLQSEGYLVIPAENGQQALDLANKSSVDLVLLDLNMPVKNGWDTFEQLTRDHPLIPIIIVTARPNQLFTAINAGVGALLEKPMDIPMLLRTMEKLLVETTEQRLARLAGIETEFHYQAATAGHGHSRP